MKGSTIIKNCTAAGTGGACHIEGGSSDPVTFTMDGGSITGCSAKYGGGAVAVYYGTAAIQNGAITDCSAEKNGGAVYCYETDCTVSGAAQVTGSTNTTSGAASNIYLREGSSLTLADSLTGSIGVTQPGAAAGVKFGENAGGFAGYANIVCDTDEKLFGGMSGTDLIWTVKSSPQPAPAPAPAYRPAYGAGYGGSGDTGSGHYSQYPRTADGAAGTISFGSSPNVKSVDLPEGVKGEVVLNLKTSETGPDGAETALVFEINIPDYPAGMPATINVELSLADIEKAGHNPADAVVMHKESDGTWTPLPTTYEVSGNKVKYTATATAFSPFAVVYADPGSRAAKAAEDAAEQAPAQAPAAEQTAAAPAVQQTAAPAAPAATEAASSPAPLAGLLAGLGALLVLRRK